MTNTNLPNRLKTRLAERQAEVDRLEAIERPLHDARWSSWPESFDAYLAASSERARAEQLLHRTERAISRLPIDQWLSIQDDGLLAP